MERSRDDAASKMLYKALNSFSVVFTGALIGLDINNVFQSTKRVKFVFEKVPDITALNEFSTRTVKEIGGPQQVSIIC